MMALESGSQFVASMAMISSFADQARRMPIYPTVEAMIAMRRLLGSCLDYVVQHENEVIDMVPHVAPTATIIALNAARSKRKLKG